MSHNLPQAMKAVRISKLGGPEVLELVNDEPTPSMRTGHVIVRNEYCGLNYIDTYFRAGVYKASLPMITGREGAGTIVAIQDETLAASLNIKLGDRVAYMHPGAAAEYTAVPISQVVKIPSGVSSEQAAAGLLQALTALTFIQEAGQVKKGQWTLVQAAAGGVGLILVQMLTSIGAKVIAAASTDEKLAMAKKNGAHYIVKSGDTRFVESVLDITEGHGVDVIFDGIGKATFDADLGMVARKGTIVCFGNASGVVPPFDLLRLGAKNVRLMRPTVTNYVSEREELEYYAAEMFKLIESGQLNIHVHKTYSLKDIAQAHVDLEGRGTFGKLVIKID